MTTTACRTCTICGATMSQRALYLTEDYGDGQRWQCRSGRQCAKRWQASFAADLAHLLVID